MVTRVDAGATDGAGFIAVGKIDRLQVFVFYFGMPACFVLLADGGIKGADVGTAGGFNKIFHIPLESRNKKYMETRVGFINFKAGQSVANRAYGIIIHTDLLLALLDPEYAYKKHMNHPTP